MVNYVPSVVPCLTQYNLKHDTIYRRLSLQYFRLQYDAIHVVVDLKNDESALVYSLTASHPVRLPIHSLFPPSLPQTTQQFVMTNIRLYDGPSMLKTIVNPCRMKCVDTALQSRGTTLEPPLVAIGDLLSPSEGSAKNRGSSNILGLL